jgi:hypothetical protein
MEGQRPEGCGTGPEAWLDAIVAAGFDGLLVPTTTPDLLATCAEVRRRGLGLALGCIASSGRDLDPVLAVVEALGRGVVDHVNLQPDHRTRTVRESLDPLRAWAALAAAADLPLYVETHRGRMTNDLLFTLDLLEALPELTLTADLSHYVVAREMRLPISAENQAWLGAVLARSRAFHGRVGSAAQIQGQIGFAQNRAWLECFEGWWEDGLRRLASELPPDATVVFTTELGPPPFYAVRGPDGAELSDRWQESLELMRRAREIGARVGAL